MSNPSTIYGMEPDQWLPAIYEVMRDLVRGSPARSHPHAWPQTWLSLEGNGSTPVLASERLHQFTQLMLSHLPHDMDLIRRAYTPYQHQLCMLISEGLRLMVYDAKTDHDRGFKVCMGMREALGRGIISIAEAVYCETWPDGELVSVPVTLTPTSITVS